MKTLMYDISGQVKGVIRDSTQGEFYFILQRKANGVPAVVATSDGDLECTGQLKDHFSRDFGLVGGE